MITITDKLAGQTIRFHAATTVRDLYVVRDFIRDHELLGMDTESTNLNCYRPDWLLRTVQFGNKTDAYVVPARFRKFIAWAFRQPVQFIGHNGPHDVRCVDRHLGYETGVICEETHIPSHHVDSRGKDEGGTGHGLKELSIARIDKNAGKWDIARKEAFKEILIPMPGEFYKSGPRRGMPKYRKAKLEEGWGLIRWDHPAMIAYAGADPILTYRLWEQEQNLVQQFHDLYEFDLEVNQAFDELQRRGFPVDVPYTKRLSRAFDRKAQSLMERARDEFECDNVNSGDQVAETLLRLKIKLTEKTDSGKWKMDANLMRALMKDPYVNAKAKQFLHYVILAKQLTKRNKAYALAILREMDENHRIHTSLNALAARTSRSSAKQPPLQQLPTKDHEDELMWESEE